MPLHRFVSMQRIRPGTVGHVLGALVNALLLGAVHLWPGWQVVPFLTADTVAVLGAVDAMLVTGIVVHLLLLGRAAPWWTPAGTLATSVAGLVATVRVLQVFPFSFDRGFDWSPVIAWLLVLGIVGTVVGAGIAVVELVRLRRITSA